MFASVWLGAGALPLEARPVPTGREIAERVDARDQGRDLRMEMIATLMDRSGGERTRKLVLLRRTEGGRDQTLVRFTYPADIEGTALLVRERAGLDTSEWLLYLPAVGRSRRVAPAQRYDRFAGTDFSYEDIAGTDIDEYDYELVEPATGDQPLHVLEAVPRSSDAFYDRELRWVDPELDMVVRVDFFRRGELVKRYLASDPELFDSIWTMRRLEMQDLSREHETVLEITEARYNSGVQPEELTRRALETGR